MKRIISSLMKRPLKNYNVENRARKVLEKNEIKPDAAPKHPSTVQQLDRFRKEHPELLEEQKQKDVELHSRLKGMIVNPDKVGEIQSRPLPESRKKMDDPEFGYLEPDDVPEGKCAIRQALTFISDHSTNPMENTASHIAEEYKLDIVQVEKVLKHFHMYQIQMPKDPTKMDSLEGGRNASPIDMAKRLLSRTNSKLPTPDSKSDLPAGKD